MLQILPGAPESELRLQVFEIDLNHTHPYHAISYTWGDDLATTTIDVDGVPHEIRHNLFGCLLQLRARSYSSHVWVDAISIRQDDLVEKGQQVGMIGDIFRKAERVLVWVGEHADGTEALFQRLSSVQWRQRPPTLEDNSRRLRAWIRFMARPYFRRLWIVQEIVLAHDVILHCGDSSVAWSRLAKLLHAKYSSSVLDWDGVDLFQCAGTVTSTFENQIRGLTMLVRMRHLLSDKSAWSRVKTCVRKPFHRGVNSAMTGFMSMVFNNNLCSDPRDYVYALLSLEQSPKLRSFKPDYNMDESELFIHFCVAKLCHWPPRDLHTCCSMDTQQFEKATMVAGLARRLLHRGDLARKAIVIGEHLYKDSGTSKQENRALDWIIGLLMSRDWEEAWSSER